MGIKKVYNTKILSNNQTIPLYYSDIVSHATPEPNVADYPMFSKASNTTGGYGEFQDFSLRNMQMNLTNNASTSNYSLYYTANESFDANNTRIQRYSTFNTNIYDIGTNKYVEISGPQQDIRMGDWAGYNKNQIESNLFVNPGNNVYVSNRYVNRTSNVFPSYIPTDDIYSMNSNISINYLKKLAGKGYNADKVAVKLRFEDHDSGSTDSYQYYTTLFNSSSSNFGFDSYYGRFIVKTQSHLDIGPLYHNKRYDLYFTHFLTTGTPTYGNENINIMLYGEEQQLNGYFFVYKDYLYFDVDNTQNENNLPPDRIGTADYQNNMWPEMIRFDNDWPDLYLSMTNCTPGTPNVESRIKLYLNSNMADVDDVLTATYYGYQSENSWLDHLDIYWGTLGDQDHGKLRYNIVNAPKLNQTNSKHRDVVVTAWGKPEYRSPDDEPGYIYDVSVNIRQYYKYVTLKPDASIIIWNYSDTGQTGHFYIHESTIEHIWKQRTTSNSHFKFTRTTDDNLTSYNSRNHRFFSSDLPDGKYVMMETTKSNTSYNDHVEYIDCYNLDDDDSAVYASVKVTQKGAPCESFDRYDFDDIDNCLPNTHVDAQICVPANTQWRIPNEVINSNTNVTSSPGSGTTGSSSKNIIDIEVSLDNVDNCPEDDTNYIMKLQFYENSNWVEKDRCNGTVKGSGDGGPEGGGGGDDPPDPV